MKHLTNTANWVVTERIRLSAEQIHKLLAGESVLFRTGTNIMGETLCIKIEPRKP